MNEITMSLQADRLLLQALEEDISSEDVTTNAVMPEAAAGQVELICKQEGNIAGLSVFRRVFELLEEHTQVDFFCRDGDAVKEAVEAGADIIMLDNMSDDQIRQAVEIIGGRAKTECSGNVTRENILRLASLGVDYISSGALTHSAGILDLSMKNLRAV